MHQKPCYISSAWWPWSPAQMGCAGAGLPRGRLLWGSPGPSQTLHSRDTHNVLSRQLASVIQAHLSSVITDNILTLDIHVFASYLVGEAEKVRAAGWKVLGDFLFSLGFCQIDSMFVEMLGLLLAATILPGFSVSPLFLDYTVDFSIPPPGLFLPPVFLSWPAHIFRCLRQTGLQLSPDLFCSTATNIVWGRLCDKSLLVLWLSLWLPEGSGP